MQTDRNKWIEEVLSSTDGMSPARTSDMTDSILARAGERRLSIEASSSMIWKIAASVVILVALNVSTLYIYNSYQQKSPPSESQSVASAFGLGSGDRQVDPMKIFFEN